MSDPKKTQAASGPFALDPLPPAKILSTNEKLVSN